MQMHCPRLSSHSMQMEDDERTTEISQDNESKSYDSELQALSDPPQLTTAVLDNTASDDHMPGKSPSTTNHDVAADQLPPLAISAGGSMGTRFDYVSSRAMIADTSPSGLELTDDNDGLPLPIGNVEVVANAVEPLKQIGRVEVIKDNNIGPTPPISMLEDSLNAAENCIKSTSKFSNELSPSPTPFAEFEDEDDDSTVKQKAKEMNKKPAAASDEEHHNHANGVDTRGVFNTIEGGGCGDVESNDIGGNDEEVVDTIQVDITREEDAAIHIPEAFLVNSLHEEVYNATPLEPTLPWYKQRKFVIGGSLAVLLFSAMAVAVGVLVESQNNNLDEALSAGTSVSPSPSPIDCSSWYWYMSPGHPGHKQNATLVTVFEDLESQCPNAYTETDTSISYDYVAGCPDSVKSDLKDTCEEAGGSFTEPVSWRIACSLDSESSEVIMTLNECLHPSCDLDNYLDRLVESPEVQQILDESEALGMTCTFSSSSATKCATGMAKLAEDATLGAAFEDLESQCPNAYTETDTSITYDYVAGCPDRVKSDLKDTCEEAGGSFTEPATLRYACSLDSESSEVIMTLNECLHPSCDLDNYLDRLVESPEVQQILDESEALGMTCTFSSSSAPSIRRLGQES